MANQNDDTMILWPIKTLTRFTRGEIRFLFHLSDAFLMSDHIIQGFFPYVSTLSNDILAVIYDIAVVLLFIRHFTFSHSNFDTK